MTVPAIVPPVPALNVGVHVVAGEQRLAETVRALYDTIGGAFDLLILADPAPGEEAAVAALLDGVRGVPQWRAPFPGGGAACFNRLVAQPAAVHVLIEAGALPAPEWLDRLLGALHDDPANGLAGPATNRSWNAQQVAPECDGTALRIERDGEALAAAHGTRWHSLAPLHGIGDFCLAVRGDVVAAIGAADTVYGRGPCWEMDYAARAIRAGFRSVWVPAAFVWRAPAGPVRAAAEAAAMARSKRLYQDRFCARRAAPIAGDLPYRDHCRGGDCANFAPPETTRVHLPLPSSAPPVPQFDRPMISCIMPTRGRPRFVERAIRYFRAQDYPNLELIIIHDADDDLPPDIGGDDVQVLRAVQGSIGAKRNQGIAAARGALIAQWDDDDWYGPGRLSYQAAPILAGVADVTALNDILFLDVEARSFWAVTRGLFRGLFVENVHGGTLMFRRENWRRDGPYPATSLREDADLLTQMMRGGAQLCRRPARDHQVYIRHAHNTWQFGIGSYLDQAAWRKAEEPTSFATDRSFYFGAETSAPAFPAAVSAPAPVAFVAARRPMVSCIMPTADRRGFVPAAIRQFLAQDYPERELIVIDDGADDIADLLPDDDRIRHVRLAPRRSVGAKRNLACELASGDIIVHWDDDDWMAPGWITAQVAALRDNDADIAGLSDILFHAPGTRGAWRYIYDGVEPWVYGGTLCYTRAYWQRTRFADHDIGEDNAFVWSGKTDRIAVNPGRDLYVGTIHDRNTSIKDPRQRRWHPYPVELVERLIHGRSVAHCV